MKTFLTGTALALAAAAPAYAQAPICGGISVVGDWVGGDEASSGLTGVATPFDASGQVPIAGHLVRMFTLSEETEIRIDVAAEPAGDPYISVFDAGGAEVAADDDSGGDFASRIVSSLPAGTYCLAARSYESGVTDVSVQIGAATAFDDAVPDEPVDTPSASQGSGAECFEAGTARLGDDFDLAALSAGGVTASGSMGTTPGFAFTLAEAMPLSITATSESGDPLIRLLDADGAVLAENDDFSGLDSQIDVTQSLPPGAYCVELEDLNGADNPITLGLQAFDPAADRLRRLNAAEFAPTSADDVTVTDLGVIETALLREVQAGPDATWFRLSVPSGGLLLTEVIGDGLDPSVVLFDRVGRRVAENDDGPDGLDSFLASRLLPGTYTLAISLIDDSSSGPVRLLMERYVPAP